MPYNIKELQQLPLKEKLKLIEELELSIVAEDQAVYGIKEGIEEDESPEVIHMLEERLAEYNAGETKSIPWEEAKSTILQNLQSKYK